MTNLKLLFIPCEENNFKPGFINGRFLFYYIVLLSFLKLVSISSIIYIPKTIFFADISSYSLIELTNKSREALGLKTLTKNPALVEAATLKANDMIAKDYFAHNSPEGKSPWYWFREAGYNYQYAGENLAIGFLDAEEIYLAWNESPLHKQNLINSHYTDIGIAIAKGDFQGNEVYVVVQLLGATKEGAKTAPVPVPVGGEEETPPKQETPSIKEPEKKEGETWVVAGKEEKPGETTVEKPKPAVGVGGTSTLSPYGMGNNLIFNLSRFFVTKYDNILQTIVFYSLLLTLMAFILNIMIRFNVQYLDLIVRTAVFLFILALFTFADKGVIIQFIPHQLGIL